MLIVLAVHRESLRTFVSAHGMLHIAIARQFIDGLNIPPDNPFMAGAQLPYYWVYHFFGAMIARALGVHPLVAFEIMVLTSALAIWMAAGAIARRLTGNPAQGVWIALIALCGAQALGGWYFLAKLAIGSGAVPPDTGGYLWGIVHPVVGQARISDPTGLYGPLYFFFINVTARSMALASLLVVAATILAWQQDGNRRNLIGLAVATAVCTAFSPLIGIAAGLSLAGGLTLTWIIGRRFPSWRLAGDSPVLHALAPSAAIIVGIAAAAPTFLVLAEEGSVALNLSRREVIATATGILLPGALALLALRRTDGRVRGLVLAILLACGALLGATVMLELPVMNATNFFHAAALLLAIPAGAALLTAPGVRRRRIETAAVILLMIPTTAIVIRGFTNRPGIHVRLEGNTLTRLNTGDGFAELYQWIASETAPNSVIVLDPRAPIMTAVGNAPELPALTGRALFASRAPSYVIQPLAEAPARIALAERLSDGEQLTAADSSLLSSLGRPAVLVTSRTTDAALMARLTTLHGAASFRHDSLAAFRLTP